MRALKKARQLIEQRPTAKDSLLLASLVLAIEGQGQFDVVDLYELDFDAFGLAIEILKEWRLDQHFSAKFRLIDMALASAELEASSTAEAHGLSVTKAVTS